MAIVDLAMFEAVNSIDPRYQPYKAALPATQGTSQEAAAATAAAVAMTKLLPDVAADIQAALTSYLAALPDGTAKADGIKLGTPIPLLAPVISVMREIGTGMANSLAYGI
jgi:hypothetical protein